MRRCRGATKCCFSCPDHLKEKLRQYIEAIQSEARPQIQFTAESQSDRHAEKLT